MLMATAIAARTSTLPIAVAALLLPLYDPVRLAEEMSVLDIISGGRVSYIAAIGYRPEEYETYGVDFHKRGRIVEDKLKVLLKARTGQPFEHEGRRVYATPGPVTPGGPMLALGGGTLVAARRAGRLGLGFFAERGDPELRAAFEEAAREAGLEPGMCILSPVEAPSTIFVADDVDKAWDELGPYMMHDVLSYAAWNAGKTGTASLSFVSTAEELRAENGSHRILGVDEAVEFVRTGSPLPLHPLIGGLPPDIAWRYLRTVSDEVMPALAGAR
jgi:alkanesulfonate monooxygenase SsuD/methylene tetrahydromethanopterin reductase-like flavin-dependent oxidoreductase (luciferase family)